MSWDYGRLVAEVYELDKPVGSTFAGLEYYTRQLAGVSGAHPGAGHRDGARPLDLPRRPTAIVDTVR